MSSMLNEERNDVDQLSLIGKYILKPEPELQDDDWNSGSFSDSNMDTFSSSSHHGSGNGSPEEGFFNHHPHSSSCGHNLHHDDDIDDEDLQLHQVGYFDQDGLGYGQVYTQESIENQLNDESYKHLQVELQSQYKLSPDLDEFDEELHDTLNAPIFTVIDAYHAFTMRKRVEEANQQWGTGIEDEELTRERQFKVQFSDDVTCYTINSRAEDEEEYCDENVFYLQDAPALNNNNVIDDKDKAAITLEQHQQKYEMLNELMGYKSFESCFDSPECPVTTPVSSQSDFDLTPKSSSSDLAIEMHQSLIKSLPPSLSSHPDPDEMNYDTNNNYNCTHSNDNNINNNSIINIESKSSTNNTITNDNNITRIEEVTNQYEKKQSLTNKQQQKQTEVKHTHNKTKSSAPDSSKTKIRKLSSVKKGQNDTSNNYNNSSVNTFNYNNNTNIAEDRGPKPQKKRIIKPQIGEGVELSFLSNHLSKEPTQTSKLRNLLKASKFALRKNLESSKTTTANTHNKNSDHNLNPNNNLIFSTDSNSQLLGTRTSCHKINKKTAAADGRLFKPNISSTAFPPPKSTSTNNSNELTPTINPILQSVLDPKNLNMLSKSKSCTQNSIVLRELKTQILKHNIQKSSLEHRLNKRIINLIYNDSSLSPNSSNIVNLQGHSTTHYCQQTVSSKSKTKTSISSRNTQSQLPYQSHPINFGGGGGGGAAGRSKWSSRPDFISFANKLKSLRTTDQQQQPQSQNGSRATNGKNTKIKGLTFEKIGDHAGEKEKKKSKLERASASLSLDMQSTKTKLTKALPGNTNHNSTTTTTQSQRKVTRHSHSLLTRTVKT